MHLRVVIECCFCQHVLNPMRLKFVDGRLTTIKFIRYDVVVVIWMDHYVVALSIASAVSAIIGVVAMTIASAVAVANS